MKRRLVVAVCLSLLAAVGLVFDCSAGQPAGTRNCAPDRPIPPESVGSISVPFDLPIWPTLLKTEFHILPWVSLSKVSVCIPGTCKAVEFSAPVFSLKPIPLWFPWLRPLDVETSDTSCSR
jgi:hypothetical protein